MAAAREKGEAMDKISPQPPVAVTSEMRREMIAKAAYFRAERRGFAGGDADEDWFAAEAEVNVILQGRAQPEEGRGAMEQRLEAELREWDKRLDELTARARKAKSDVRKEMERQLEALLARRTALREQLNGLREQSALAWSDLREGIEKAWADMRQAVDSMQARFK